MRLQNRLRQIIIVAFVLAFASAAFAQDGDARKKVQRKKGFFAPQFSMESDGTLLMLWVHPDGDGWNLNLSHRLEGEHFSEPLQVNQNNAAVNFIPFDEHRPSIASGGDGMVAIAWADTDGNIRLWTGKEHGNKKISEVTLNKKEGRAVRGFVSVTIDKNSTAHAVWIDARTALAGEEEPAHIYYASVHRGKAGLEKNLSGEFTESVCGCCRPTIYIDKYGAEVLYRNVSEEGYRDVFLMRGSNMNHLSEPTPFGDAHWKLAGCPAAGPVSDGKERFWRDGSTGEMRILRAASQTMNPMPFLSSDDDWSSTLSPRFVQSNSKVSILLVPGEPDGKVLARVKKKWITLMENIPSWCTSMAYTEGQILMMGEIYGQLYLEARDVEWGI